MRKLLAAAAAVIMTFAMCGCGEKSKDVEYRSATLPDEAVKPITLYFDGFVNNDPESVAMSCVPQSAIDKYKEDSFYEDEIIAEFQRSIDATVETYGKGLQLQATSNFIGSPFGDNSILCAENYFADFYSDLGMTFTVEQGYSVKFDYKISGEEDSLEGVQESCLVKLENDGWKLIFLNEDTLNALYNGAELELGGNGDAE